MPGDTLLALLETIGCPPSMGKVVDALVPAWADIAVVVLPRDEALRIVAYAHINPSQLGALEALSRIHAPRPDDPISAFARVFRSGIPALLAPPDSATLKNKVTDPSVRASFEILGPRTMLLAPLLGGPSSGTSLGVITTAMSSSGRIIDEGDLEELAAFAREVGRRM